MPLRLLLIDDEAGLTELAGSFLRLNGFEMEACNDPMEGLKLLEAKAYDALLIDLMMFPMDGMSVVRKLREISACAALPVFVLSAKSLNDAERREMLALKVHYISKPFIGRRLVEDIRAQLKPA